MAITRSPRGFGSIIKMGGNRRNPYMVRIQIGKKINEEKGTVLPEYKILGYTKTRKDGILMLEQYHNNPYDFANNVKFYEIYEKTCHEFLVGKSRSTHLAYEASFKACEKLHNKVFKDIKVIDLQHVIDTCGKNYPTLRKIKVMLNMMYKYAMKYDLCGKDYSEYIDILKYKDKNPDKIDRLPFTKEDIDVLWDLSNDRWYQIILMLIYTGTRISEFLELKKENINLEEQWFDVVKSKTESGIRRVPIADCILPFFKEWYEYSTIDYLICTPEQKKMLYRNYRDAYWSGILNEINMSQYTPHCTRHTCISLLAEQKVDPTTIKKIVGHSGAMTLTERVYTHLDISILIEAVNKMYKPETK